MFSQTRRFIAKFNSFYVPFSREFHDTCVLCKWPRVSKGSRNVKKARKYIPPDLLYEDPNYNGIGPHIKVKSLTDSLKARGFPKEKKSYSPTQNVETQVYTIYQSTYKPQSNEDWKNFVLSDPSLKFKLLTKCIEEFEHDIPSSFLCKLKHVCDVIEYFNTPVEGTSPYEKLIRDSDNLPKNLHVIPDPIVFNPDTDTFFEGQTAFPGRKRIIHTKRGQEFEKTVEWPNV